MSDGRIRFTSDESGAVAVLYSILMLLMVGLAAIVIDLGALRADRRSTQSTADLASTSGALQLLSEFGGSPQQACQAALGYFLDNTPGAGTPPGSACASFPTSDDACYTSAGYAPIVEEIPADPYVVTVIWPVDYGQTVGSGGVDVMPAAGYDPELDGERCERLAFHASRTRGFVFGSVFGTTLSATGAPAVARAVVGSEGEDVANVLLLDKHGCDALRTVGSTKVRVIAVPDLDNPGEWHSGKIYVDSDAADCSPGYTINAGGGGTILAEGDDANPPAPGQIRLFALPAGATTCTGNACNPAEIMPSYDINGPGIWPQPLHLSRRINRTQIDHTYNCKSDYTSLDGTAPRNLAWDVPACEDPTPTSNHIDRLRAAIGTGAANPSPWDPLTNINGFLNWSTLLVPGGCNPNVDVVVPPGNWYVDCPNPTGFKVTKSITFQGGNIVFRGEVNIAAGGTLTINNANPSPALPDPPCLDQLCFKTSSAKAAYVYIGSGDLRQGSPTANFNLDNAFVYLREGVAHVTAGAFTWIAPNEGPFQHLALWDDHEPTSPAANPSPTTHSLLGSGTTTMEGVYFTPNSITKISGGAGSTPKDAQFFTWDLEVSGGGTLLVKPNAARSIKLPSFEGVRLIR